MDYDYQEAMKLANQLCFPLYAAARHVTGLYTPVLRPLGRRRDQREAAAG